MATGYSVLDALNKNSKAGIDTSPSGKFRTKDISIHKMYSNENNFYSVKDIEELAQTILMCGLKQNLEVMYAPCEKGEYKIIAGERRWQALLQLYSQGYEQFEIATCKLTSPHDADEEQIDIILANMYRVKSTRELIEEERRLKETLKRMKEQGNTIKGVDLKSEPLRAVVASMMQKSETKIAQIEAIDNNLIPEFREELYEERLTFSAALELAGMEKEEQAEAYEEYQETGELTYTDIKKMKRGKEAESDTEPDVFSPQPDNMTSICWTCRNYDKCLEKSSTVKNCNEYIDKNISSKAVAELEAIDDEAEEDEAAPEYEEDAAQACTVHAVKTESQYFIMARQGIKTFTIRKNDRDYKAGDILEKHETENGIETGRILKAEIVYFLDNVAGLEKGYCILGIRLID